jgi:large subunit ribosomal protein L14e
LPGLSALDAHLLALVFARLSCLAHLAVCPFQFCSTLFPQKETKMPAAKGGLYQRYAQIGRVVLINYGPEAGKLATIVDIIDQNLALIDGPANITGVKRQVINFKWLQLTDLKAAGFVDGKAIGIARNARQKTLTKVWTALDLKNKFAKSSWGKKIAAKAAKAESTDFSRFQAKTKKRATAAAVAKKLKA